MNPLEPDVAQVLAQGTHSFLGLELLVAEGALVPRAETELLGAEAIRLLGQRASPSTVIDVCCGSGNLGCAIAVRVKAATVYLSDLTASCARLARRNVERLGLGPRAQVFEGDLFEPLRAVLPGAGVDLIVCNPPYISSGKLEGARATLLEHEPREAFDGGPYGLSIHQRVIKQAVELLVPGGQLLFEFGLGQAPQLAALFARARAYTDVRFVEDAQGAARVVVAVKAAQS